MRLIFCPPHLGTREIIEFVVESAVRDAIGDGVVVLEMSFDIRRTAFYADGLAGVRRHLKALAARYRPQIDLRPELGIPRQIAANPELMSLAEQAIELGFFQSIDLYDHQEACAPEAVEPLYAKARRRWHETESAGRRIRGRGGDTADGRTACIGGSSARYWRGRVG